MPTGGSEKYPFLSLKSKPSRVLFLMAFKCLLDKRKVPVKGGWTLGPQQGDSWLERAGLGNLAGSWGRDPDVLPEGNVGIRAEPLPPLTPAWGEEAAPCPVLVLVGVTGEAAALGC